MRDTKRMGGLEREKGVNRERERETKETGLLFALGGKKRGMALR